MTEHQGRHEPQQTPRRILLVEDNELNRDMLSRRLEKKGFEILMAADANEGLQLARTQSPDLILMDMRLPDLDGWSATRQLKADGATSRIPVIALTAHAMDRDRTAALAAGCDDFDTKPVEMERLMGKICTLLARGV
jgi:two-component system, cell cycle response regulator DivK